jgi:hypothetical protein
MKALNIAGYVILGLLLVPPILFFAFYFAAGGPKSDTGHPPAILIPYLYVFLGFRFLAPIGAAAFLAAAWLAIMRAMPAWTRFRALALGLFFCCSSAVAWLHQFR